MLQKHLERLRAAHPHPNRTLFFDDEAIAYLLAFFSPAIRSLRTLEDFSQTPEMRRRTSVDCIHRSTLSDANKVFDPALLEPIIAELRARLPDLDRADPKLGELTRPVRAADGSLFTVAATVTWALQSRRANKKKHAAIRLNLQLAVATGNPEGVSIGVLLMYIHTQRPVSKYAYVMLGMVASGQATMEDILPILERRERECELDRLRRARKRAQKTGK